jgi:hypothetical protein
MKRKQGGTRKWCPHCRAVTVNKGFRGITDMPLKGGQLLDPHVFSRSLVCRTCSKHWFSAELPLQFLEELIQHRKRLNEAKGLIEEISTKRDTLGWLSDNLALLAENAGCEEPLTMTDEDGLILDESLPYDGLDFDEGDLESLGGEELASLSDEPESQNGE